jgi:hypothetical protein
VESYPTFIIITRTSRNQTGFHLVRISIASYYQTAPAKRESQQIQIGAFTSHTITEAI